MEEYQMTIALSYHQSHQVLLILQDVLLIQDNLTGKEILMRGLHMPLPPLFVRLAFLPTIKLFA